MLKSFIKKIIPDFLLSWYHLGLAHLANFIFGQPSKKLTVIGITGTNGKSTTVNLVEWILEQAGNKVVLSSTVNFSDGSEEWLNDKKMTMPGRFFLQHLLARGVRNGAKFAVIECSSEGSVQHRHIGIHFDAMIFTNLTEEHIESHGGFENYKQAKLEYFRHLEKLPNKIINGKTIPKIIVVNARDSHAGEFKDFDVDRIIEFGSSDKFRAENITASEQGIGFTLNGIVFQLKLKGLFDVYNALAALAVTSALGVDIMAAKQALEKIPVVPGRMELIEEGQNFKVLVDYAPEPEGLKQMYATITHWHQGKIIHLLGSTGGGRDVARRKILGNIAGTNADIVVVTNEDPYDDDPQEIIHQVADGAVEAGKVIKENLFREPDRRKAIAKALSLAGPNDLVILTGKGAEQKMAVKGGYIPWDDRVVVREELNKLKNN